MGISPNASPCIVRWTSGPPPEAVLSQLPLPFTKLSVRVAEAGSDCEFVRVGLASSTIGTSFAIRRKLQSFPRMPCGGASGLWPCCAALAVAIPSWID